MSNEKKDIRKIPALMKSVNYNDNNKNIEYINIDSLTHKFNHIYYKYIKSKKKTIYPNLYSILNDYRAEKLNKLREQEAMREEIGEEIKNYKNIHDLAKKKVPLKEKEKYFNNIQKKEKLKESRVIILDTFYNYDNKIMTKKRKYLKDLEDTNINNFISPYKIFKIDQNSLEERIRNKLRNKTNVNFNKKKLIGLIDKRMNTNTKNMKKKKLIIKDCWSYCHNKLNVFCDSITDESIKLKINGRKTMEKFNTSWNKYKKIQEYKYPETKKQIFEDYFS